MDLLLTLLPYFFSAASLIVTIALVLRKESREDGQTVSQRLKRLEANELNDQTRMTGFQNLIEKVADHEARERQQLANDHTRDYTLLKEQIIQIPQLLERLSRLETTLNMNGKTVDKIGDKLDRLFELLTQK